MPPDPSSPPDQRRWTALHGRTAGADSLLRMRTRPDVLVLGGGGVLGEAWMMGVLAGIEDAAGFDLRDCESFVGTSAGSIVAAHLVAGRSPRRPSAVGTELEIGHAQPGARPGRGGGHGRPAGRARRRWRPARRLRRWRSGSPPPAGAVVRALMLRGVPRPPDTLARLREQVQRSGARFDGRLRVTAVDRRSGRRVVFGSPRAPHATVAEAVEASCTVPWLFAPVTIGGREYVDGGVWSPTNLDAAPAGRDTHVLCLNPTASLGTSSTPAGDDAQRRPLGGVDRVPGAAPPRRPGRTIAPNAECAAAMGSNFMDQRAAHPGAGRRLPAGPAGGRRRSGW